MTKKYILIALTVVIFAGLGFFLLKASPKVETIPGLDNFAKCLKDKGATMYGAYWCPHCQNTKKMFGTSFQYVNYVECTQDVKKCEADGIKGYPTWIFSSGERLEGEVTTQQLSEKTGCSI